MSIRTSVVLLSVATTLSGSFAAAALRRFDAPVSSRAIGLQDGAARPNGLIGSSAKPLTAADRWRNLGSADVRMKLLIKVN